MKKQIMNDNGDLKEYQKIFLDWANENRVSPDDLNNLELEMKMMHNLQNNGKLPNPLERKYKGDGVTIRTTSNKYGLVSVSDLIDGEYIYLRNFYIATQYRGNGLGTKKIKSMKNLFFAHPFIKFIEVEAENNSTLFWIKMGFKKTHKKNVLRLWR